LNIRILIFFRPLSALTLNFVSLCVRIFLFDVLCFLYVYRALNVLRATRDKTLEIHLGSFVARSFWLPGRTVAMAARDRN